MDKTKDVYKKHYIVMTHDWIVSKHSFETKKEAKNHAKEMNKSLGSKVWKVALAKRL